MIRTVPAREIKRRGLGMLDADLSDGPVHVIKNDEPTYVVMSEAHYARLLVAQREADVAGIREALDDVAAGRVTRYDDVEDFIRELGLDVDVDE
jgi:PHD/YefM family antitoxin component YafN of YafNO toxin-antitoxin module